MVVGLENDNSNHSPYAKNDQEIGLSERRFNQHQKELEYSRLYEKLDKSADELDRLNDTEPRYNRIRIKYKPNPFPALIAKMDEILSRW